MTKAFFDEPNTEDRKKLSPKDGALRFIEFMGNSRPRFHCLIRRSDRKRKSHSRRPGRIAVNIWVAERKHGRASRYDLHRALVANGPFVAIGQHVGFLDKRSQKVFETVKAWNANAARVAKAVLLNQALDDAIVDESNAIGKMAKSIEHANRIRPGVLRRLKLNSEEKYPSKGQIKARLSKIKSVSS